MTWCAKMELWLTAMHCYHVTWLPMRV
jgi:hypothetical protein